MNLALAIIVANIVALFGYPLKYDDFIIMVSQLLSKTGTFNRVGKTHLGDFRKFQKLTPVNNIDIKIYKKALNFAFAESDLTNIAVSGAYGSGKTSILESYKKTVPIPKRNFLHISLARFKNSANENDRHECEDVLEGKVINWLLHQIKPKHIPQTNFRVKSKTVWKKALWLTLLLLFFSLSIIYVSFFSAWYSFAYTHISARSLIGTVRGAFLEQSKSSLGQLIGGIISTALAGIIIFKTVRLQYHKKIIKRLNTGSVDIEIFGDEKDSHFDKNLEELIYLFKQSRADAIVFEDMDRYDSLHIYERLREINFLINTGIKKKTLKFFYLIRDDIYADARDRTKFFDFIIPVMPAMDGSNARDKILEFLKQHETCAHLKDCNTFLRDFCLYIDDIRILKNICNEYEIYYELIKDTESLPEKVMAIVAYKNLFPKDFSELQLGKGYVNAILKAKNALAEKLKKDITLKENEKQQIEDVHIESKRELDLIAAGLNSGIRNRTQAKTELDDFNNRRPEREALLDARLNSKQDILEKEIALLKARLRHIYETPLKTLINEGYANDIFLLTSKNEIGIISDYLDIKGSDYFGLLNI